MNRYTWRTGLLEAVMIVAGLLFAFPLYVLINMSLRSQNDPTSPLVPTLDPTIQNYVDAWGGTGLDKALVASIVTDRATTSGVNGVPVAATSMSSSTSSATSATSPAGPASEISLPRAWMSTARNPASMASRTSSPRPSSSTIETSAPTVMRCSTRAVTPVAGRRAGVLSAMCSACASALLRSALPWTGRCCTRVYRARAVPGPAQPSERSHAVRSEQTAVARIRCARRATQPT